jgi:Protein of unknown function (DUF3999)
MILILAFLLSVGSAEAQQSTGGWKYRGEVKAPTARFVALPLTLQNLDLCEKPDLSDLRITDVRGTPVPHAVVFEEELKKESQLSGTEFNRESLDKSASRLAVDFGRSLVKNRITVVTAGDSFRRRVLVEGSDDLRAWAVLLPDGWLIAAGNIPARRFESLDIGVNTHRYVRVTVSKMAEEEELPWIERVTCTEVIVRKPDETAIPAKLLQYKTEDGISTVEFDFGSRNVPLRRASLLLAREPARLFRKSFTVWGRDSFQHAEKVRFETGEYGKERTVDTPWTQVGSGYLYRDIDGRQSLELPLSLPHRYVRVRIVDGDSPPLELAGAKGYAVPAFIVFEPAGQSRFVLLAGNGEAPAPRYESQSVLASMDTRGLPKCPSVVLEPQQAGLEATRTPAGQAAVWVLLALAVAATAWILRMTARTPAEVSSAEP